VPDNAPAALVILDSGAFLLAQQHRHMNRRYLIALADHYQRTVDNLSASAPHHPRGVRKPSDSGENEEANKIISPLVSEVLCVAPDALFEPERTMRQWRFWYDELPR
jgi:hypothetical protein